MSKYYPPSIVSEKRIPCHHVKTGFVFHFYLSESKKLIFFYFINILTPVLGNTVCAKITGKASSATALFDHTVFPRELRPLLQQKTVVTITHVLLTITLVTIMKVYTE